MNVECRTRMSQWQKSTLDWCDWNTGLEALSNETEHVQVLCGRGSQANMEAIQTKSEQECLKGHD